jgi:hypothetical protein
MINPEWANLNFDLSPDLHAKWMLGSFVALSLSIICSTAAYRRLDYIRQNRSPEDHQDEMVLAPNSQNDLLGLVMDAGLAIGSLLKSRCFLIALGIDFFFVDLTEAYVDIGSGRDIGYSFFRHPFLFILSEVSSIILYGAATWFLDRQQAKGSISTSRWSRIKSICWGSLKGFLLTGLWLSLASYFVDMSNEVNDETYSFWALLASLIFFAIGIFMIQRYIYLSPVLILERSRLKEALPRARRLANYNRWNTLLAQCIVFSIILVMGILSSLPVVGNSKDFIVIGSSLTVPIVNTLGGAWLAAVTYLGYIDAKEGVDTLQDSRSRLGQ